MRTRILILMLLYVVAFEGMAQTRSIQFTYDHAGNRTSRAIVLASAAKTRQAANDSIKTAPEIYTDTFDEYQLRVSPNPTHGELKIELRGLPSGETYHLLIVSASGEVIVSHKTSDNPTVVNLTECPAGIYIMRIKYKDCTKDFKIIRL